jgi:hypothetical protein
MWDPSAQGAWIGSRLKLALMEIALAPGVTRWANAAMQQSTRQALSALPDGDTPELRALPRGRILRAAFTAPGAPWGRAARRRKELVAMSHPSTPTGNNGNPHRPRNRGAIRTHLGRKRVGPRSRATRDGVAGARESAAAARSAQEALFDRLLDAFQRVFAKAGETTANAFDTALDAACSTLVAAGEFTAENAPRLREYLRRDLLQRDHPAMTFRTGDITTAGTLTCSGCGWTIRTTRTTVLPPCPQCVETSYRKTA